MIYFYYYFIILLFFNYYYYYYIYIYICCVGTQKWVNKSHVHLKAATCSLIGVVTHALATQLLYGLEHLLHSPGTKRNLGMGCLSKFIWYYTIFLKIKVF